MLDGMCLNPKKNKKNKDYLRTTINLGGKNSPIRLYVEQFFKDYGKQAFSKYIRKLLLFQFTDDPLYNRHKIKMLRIEKKIIAEEMEKLSKRAEEINSEIKKYEEEPNEVDILA